MHPGGANVLLADGSVHFFADNTPQSTLVHLATISGGESDAVP
jgi:prepilin-type processing-associated H-X9-DG protein